MTSHGPETLNMILMGRAFVPGCPHLFDLYWHHICTCRSMLPDEAKVLPVVVNGWDNGGHIGTYILRKSLSSSESV